MATVYDTELSTPDEDAFAGSARLGAPLPDCPVRTKDGEGHLLESLAAEFTLLTFKNGMSPQVPDGVRLATIGEDLADPHGILAQRLDATPGASFLLRPDHHLCARWRSFDRSKIEAARNRALGRF